MDRYLRQVQLPRPCLHRGTQRFTRARLSIVFGSRKRIMASDISYKISSSVLRTTPPPIPQAWKWATSYVPTPSRPLLDMSQGVPGVPPPAVLLEKLGEAASSPSSCGYGPLDGEPVMREALAQQLKYVYGDEVDITSEDIALTSGCNLAYFVTIMALADAGDEVILPVPWYFDQQMTLSVLGIKTKPLETFAEDGFVPSAERCAALISPKTKAIALVTPNNPTGAVYSPAVISAFAKLAADNNIALIVDETYRDFVVDGRPHHVFTDKGTPWRANFVQLFSFSKSYCLPGHRLGAIVASPKLLSVIRTVFDCTQICPPRHVQIALAPLLPTLRPFVHNMAAALSTRHQLFRAALPPRWKIGAQGGYFAFVRHPYEGVSARDVCMKLAKDFGLIALPASFFCDGEAHRGDYERWIRFSIANVDDETIKKVCGRLAECEDALGWPLDSVSE